MRERSPLIQESFQQKKKGARPGELERPKNLKNDQRRWPCEQNFETIFELKTLLLRWENFYSINQALSISSSEN